MAKPRVSVMHRRAWLVVLISLQTAALGISMAQAASIDAQAVNDAKWEDRKTTQNMTRSALVKLQVLLDRAHFSPGEIDGKPGENVDKAIAAYAAAQGASAGAGMNAELW